MLPPVVEATARLLVALVSVALFVVGTVALWRRPTARTGLAFALLTVFLLQGTILLVEVFLVDSTLTESTFYVFQLVEVSLVAAILLQR